MPAAARPPMVKMMNSCTAVPRQNGQSPDGARLCRLHPPPRPDEPMLTRSLFVAAVARSGGLRGLGDRLVVDPPLRSALHEDEARRGLGVLVGERQACNRRLNASGVP